jgi:hypothetical protein
MIHYHSTESLRWARVFRAIELVVILAIVVAVARIFL